MPIAVAIKDQKGASAVEYVVLIALLSTIIIVAVASLGENTREVFDNTREVFDDTGSSFSTEKEHKCKDSSDDPDCGIGNDRS